mgnify:CR=1 FL=1|jgi:SNF family Na+-dependent transporter
MTTQGGMYLFQLCDSYGASGMSLLTIVLFQCIAVAWVYGRERFYEDLNNMFGYKLDPRKGLWPIIGYIWQVKNTKANYKKYILFSMQILADKNFETNSFRT